MAGVIRSAVLACALSLVWALPAVAAPTWSAPTPLSGAGNAVAFRPSVAINDGGVAVETWAETIAGTSVIRAATHTTGGDWVRFPAGLSNSIPGDGCQPYASVDPAGNALVVWTQYAGPGCFSGTQTILFATHAAGAATWSSPGVVGAGATAGDWQPMAGANAAGQIVVAWSTADATNNTIFGAVGSATGGFGAAQKLFQAPLADTEYYMAAAIGPNGDAAVSWQHLTGSNSNVEVSVQPRNGSFPATATPMTALASPSSSSLGALAVDGAGDVIAGYSEYNGTSSSFVTRTRGAVSGVWGPELTVATPVAPFTLSWVSVGLDGAGTAIALWMESDFTTPPATSPYPRRLWAASLPAGFSFGWGGKAPITDVIRANYSTPSIVVAPSGAAAVDWEIANPQNSAQALYRPPGGSFSALTGIGTGSGANVSIAPGGDAAISFVGDAASDARVSVLDASGPGFASVAVPATGTTGQAVSMSAVAVDGWSGLGAGQPTWTFGDGGSGAGATVSHAFAAPGTYTVTIGARDGLGNAGAPATRQIVVSNATGAPPPPPPGGGSGVATTIARPKVKAVWNASHLVGTVSVSGTVGANATLTVSGRLHGAKKTAFKSSFKVKAGKWTHTLKLPTSLAPGRYDVAVTGAGVKTSQTSFTLAAPSSGIVKRSYASGPRKGPEATTLSGTSELWAHFVFGTLPKKGQTITTQWILPSGSKLAANTRPRTSLVEAQVKDLNGKPLPTGRWRCVITAGGVVVATLNVRLR